MRYISLFSGIEAASVAWKDLGWDPVAFCEIDDFPSKVLAKHFPHVPNLGDITKVDWTQYRGDVDLVVGGSPCFPKGSLVMTEHGLVPIEDVSVGDMVITHKGRLKRVLRTGGKVADTIIVKGQGSVGIECTPNHKFFSRKKTRKWDNAKRSYKMIPDSESTWVEAKDLVGSFWLNVCSCDSIDIPRFKECAERPRKNVYNDYEFTEAFFYFVGRYLGDGWIADASGKNVGICCNQKQIDYLRSKLEETELKFSESEQNRLHRFTFYSEQLYDWILDNFGKGAGGKNIPSWCLSMKEEFREALLLGYRESDGCECKNHWQSSTISRKLSIGIKMLAGSLGYTNSITLVIPSNENKTIEGRHVNENPYYTQRHSTNSRSAFFADSGWYGQVKNISEGSKSVMVYNLEVEDDHSYTIDGIAVSNCQSFSVAGNREGLKGESGLMFEYIRAVREIMPDYFIWENVPGSLSVEDGRAFGQLLSEMDDIGYGMAWRVLDAQFFGVAQRRRRVFLVGCLAGPERPAEILFEQESLRWDYPSNRAKRERLTGCSEGRSELRDAQGDERVAKTKKFKKKSLLFSSKSDDIEEDYDDIDDDVQSNCLTPYDPQSKRVFTKDGPSPTLDASFPPTICLQGNVGNGLSYNQNGKGWTDDGTCYTLNTRDRHVVCMESTQAHAMVSDIVGTLSARSYKDAPVVIDRAAFNQGKNAQYDPYIEETETMPTLVARGPHAVANPPAYIVRRLTPIECERLQGFEDNWTKVDENTTDMNRYKAIGNSMAVPVMRWIGQRLDDIDKKYGSI